MSTWIKGARLLWSLFKLESEELVLYRHCCQLFIFDLDICRAYLYPFHCYKIEVKNGG